MSTKDQLVETTAELLWELGYGATSPAMVQKRAGVGQGSMYHHFKGKPDLAASAMRLTASRMRDEVLTEAAGHDTAVGRLHGYLDAERAALLGCRLGRLVQEPDVLADEPMHAAAAEFFAWLRGWLAGVLTDGQDAGELRADFDPAMIAVVVAATVQGGYVLSRAESDAGLYDLAVSGAKQLISDLAVDSAR